MKCQVGCFLLLSPLFVHASANDDVQKQHAHLEEKVQAKLKRQEQLKRLKEFNENGWKRWGDVSEETNEPMQPRRRRSSSSKSSPKAVLFLRSVSQKLDSPVEYSPRTYGRLVSKTEESIRDDNDSLPAKSSETISRQPAAPIRTVSDPCLNELSKE